MCSYKHNACIYNIYMYYFIFSYLNLYFKYSVLWLYLNQSYHFWPSILHSANHSQITFNFPYCNLFLHSFYMKKVYIFCNLFMIFVLIFFIYLQVKSEGEGKKSKSNDSYYQICNARLPKGLDPHSVPSEQLGASLGLVLNFKLNIYTAHLLWLTNANMQIKWMYDCGKHLDFHMYSYPRWATTNADLSIFHKRDSSVNYLLTCLHIWVEWIGFQIQHVNTSLNCISMSSTYVELLVKLKLLHSFEWLLHKITICATPTMPHVK